MDVKPSKQKYGLGHPSLSLLSPVISEGHFTAFVSCIHQSLRVSHQKEMAIDLVSNRFSIDTQSLHQGFPGGSDGRESACNAGDLSLIPGSGRSPGEGNGYSVQYSYVENSTVRGAWQATVHIVAESDRSQTGLSD